MSAVRDITWSTTIKAVVCGDCRMPFGLPENLYNARRADGGQFCCPNGHFICWGDNETKRLKEEKEILERRLKWAREDGTYQRELRLAAERKAAAQKGVTTKLKKRIANGVCPCCQRSFADLHRHMKGQHPDFAPQASRPVTDDAGTSEG
jgi:hypothetical protein